MLGMDGIGRIGEVLSARRSDLLLPMDLFETERRAIFLRVSKPKTYRRGKGRVQQD